MVVDPNTDRGSSDDRGNTEEEVSSGMAMANSGAPDEVEETLADITVTWMYMLNIALLPKE